ncbi:hypothetical protein KOM07_01060 [Lentilactobacillus sp. G22-6]|uniref:hypothetical protein n=1 Tax=Lentilactobacillus dabitei TaxID=2831523 RepID=UPI001C253BD2|nr:hypothetical protein [Lentilactobacillus dabitei]MBU9788153.1 hypothetical protein [Lentilactobacillus dabitei]
MQFKHSFKVWLLTLLLFVVTGILVGACLNAVFAIADYYPNLPKAHNPTDLFLYPLGFWLDYGFACLQWRCEAGHQ